MATFSCWRILVQNARKGIKESLEITICSIVSTITLYVIPPSSAIGKRPGWKEVLMIDIPLLLFTSNLIGITFARSLHYQFHSWYFHQIPFLLAMGGAWNSVILGYVNIYLFVESRRDYREEKLTIRAVLWSMVEYGWATFPSTTLSSGLLFTAHIIMLGGLLFVNKPHAIQVPSLSGKKLKQK